MCIDCARRRLDPLVAAFGSDGSWYICVRDHGNHVHIRIQVRAAQGDDAETDASEWIQINSTWSDFQTAMNETSVRHRYHLHVAEPDEQEVAPDVAAALPHQRFDAADAATAADNDEICAICYDSFFAGETVAQLPCGHRYHAACVGSWLINATTCPTCRTEVTAAAIEAASSAMPGAVQDSSPVVVMGDTSTTIRADPAEAASAPPAALVLQVTTDRERARELLRAEGRARLAAQEATFERAHAEVGSDDAGDLRSNHRASSSVWQLLGCGSRQRNAG